MPEKDDTHKKLGFFEMLKDKLSSKTNSAFDEMDSRDRIKERYRQTRNKKIAIFLLVALGVFLILVIMHAITLYKESQEVYAEKQERQTVDIKVDNFALWQQQAEQRMNNLDEKTKQRFQDIDDSLKSIKETGLLGLQEAIRKGFAEISTNVKSTNEKIDIIDKSTSKKIEDINERVLKQNSNFTTFKDELLSLLGKNSEELEKKLEELKQKQAEQVAAVQTQKDDEKTNIKQVTSGDLIGFPDSDTSTGEGVDGNESVVATNETLVKQKFKLKVETKEPDVDETYPSPNEPRNLTFDIMLGLSRAILVNGADATILGMGRQEDAPVALSILSKMSIANGEYTNTRDCLALGSAVGQMTVQKAQIRLDKISCIFTNAEGDKFIAEGQVQGWVIDENGQLGVQGVLITQEGKILRSTLPLAAVQTALDYVTRSATNVVVPAGGTTTGYQNLNASFGTGSSNAANQSLSKIIQIYEKYLQQLNPVVNIRAGREVSLLFKGGEKITLVPYKGQGIAGLDSSDDIGMGDDKYNYQESKNVFMEDF